MNFKRPLSKILLSSHILYCIVLNTDANLYNLQFEKKAF